MKTIELLAPFNRTFNKHNQGNKNLFKFNKGYTRNIRKNCSKLSL